MESTTSTTSPTLERRRKLAADTIRFLAVDAVQAANSGHPGMPMGMADAAVVLWTRFLRFDPSKPDWPNRDRFVLSAGHGSMLLYSLLHLSGYDLPMEELKSFRQWQSHTPGHPEYGDTPGVETTTGPLGQGLATAVGMAVAERHLAARFNREDFPLIDHYTYVIASDGDLMEGVTNEACSLAGHWKLGRLVVFYDDNGITIDGETDLAFTEDVVGRFDSLGWHTQQIDGHDSDAVESAIYAARADERPSIIACRTHIGFGSPNKQDTASAHGSPLGEDEVERTREALGWEHGPFEVPSEVYDFMQEPAEAGAAAREAWEELRRSYARKHPGSHQLYKEAATVAVGWEEPIGAFETGSSIATRKASGKILQALKAGLPGLMGGSADLTPSNNTRTGDDEDFRADNYAGRYLRFGVREHAMAAIANGITLHGSTRGFAATFLIFSDYMRPALRLSALMNIPTLFVFTHDSIGLGEDGPTHQPIEHLASLRAMPNLKVFRPADANETIACWKGAAESTGPAALALTRQSLPVLMPESTTQAHRGGYVLRDEDNPGIILIATGSEVHIALDAADMLSDDGFKVRVVSMPCLEVFDEQPESYRRAVLPPNIKIRVAVEAGATLGWHRYVGEAGHVVGLSRFGASAPYKDIYDGLDITPTAVAAAARRLASQPNAS